MTTPQPQKQPPPKRKPYIPPSLVGGAIPPALVLATAKVLKSVLSPMYSALKLLRLFAKFPGTPAVHKAAVGITLSQLERFTPPVLDSLDPVQRQVIEMNADRRAAFVVASVKRISTELNDAVDSGTDLSDAVSKVSAKEERYFRQHVAAEFQRTQKGNEVAVLTGRYGTVLGWKAVDDDKTTPECKAADGHNFDTRHIPDIGYPGVGPHANCRCKAVPPYPNAKMLPSSNVLAASNRFGYTEMEGQVIELARAVASTDEPYDGAGGSISAQAEKISSGLMPGSRSGVSRKKRKTGNGVTADTLASERLAVVARLRERRANANSTNNR
jgi:hypothetical protein